MSLARELKDLLQVLFVLRIDRQGDVKVRAAERVFPVGGRIGAEIMQDRGARSHALSEFDRKTVQRRLRQAQCLEALEREGDSQPAGQRRHPPLVGGRDVRKDPPQHFTSLSGVAYTEKDVFAAIG